MKITLDRREAAKLLLLLDYAIDDNDQIPIAKEFSVIRFKIKEAVDKWDNRRLRKGDEDEPRTVPLYPMKKGEDDE